VLTPDRAVSSLSVVSDGESVEVVGEDRPACPGAHPVVAFEAGAAEAVAAFEVADARGVKKLEPGRVGLRYRLLAGGDEALGCRRRSGASPESVVSGGWCAVGACRTATDVVDGFRLADDGDGALRVRRERALAATPAARVVLATRSELTAAPHGPGRARAGRPAAVRHERLGRNRREPRPDRRRDLPRGRRPRGCRDSRGRVQDPFRRPAGHRPGREGTATRWGRSAAALEPISADQSGREKGAGGTPISA
jgi:hypothetical protein